METRWLYVTSENFAALREASKKTCIIPMGCMEKHGLHLPVGTDILKGSKVAYEASKIETVCVFPDFTFGDICIGPHKKAPDGTISLGVEMQMELLEKLCDQIAENGFEKILVVNSHGGNRPWLDTFSRNLGMRPHKFVFAYTYVPFAAPHQMAEIILEKGSGSIPELTKEDEELLVKYHEAGMKTGHACMGETSLMMGTAPETVHLERLGIESGQKISVPHVEKLRDAGVTLTSNGWGYHCPNWFSGDDPVGCTETIGKAAVRMAAEYVANAIKAFKDDEEIVPKAKASWKDGSWK